MRGGRRNDGGEEESPSESPSGERRFETKSDSAFRNEWIRVGWEVSVLVFFGGRKGSLHFVYFISFITLLQHDVDILSLFYLDDVSKKNSVFPLQMCGRKYQLFMNRGSRTFGRGWVINS